MSFLSLNPERILEVLMCLHFASQTSRSTRKLNLPETAIKTCKIQILLAKEKLFALLLTIKPLLMVFGNEKIAKDIQVYLIERDGEIILP